MTGSQRSETVLVIGESAAQLSSERLRDTQLVAQAFEAGLGGQSVDRQLLQGLLVPGRWGLGIVQSVDDLEEVAHLLQAESQGFMSLTICNLLASAWL